MIKVTFFKVTIFLKIYKFYNIYLAKTKNLNLISLSPYGCGDLVFGATLNLA